MSRPLSDYPETVRKLILEMGINTRVEASAPELAVLINEPLGRVSRVLNVMHKAGTLDLEYEQQHGVKGGGRKPIYRITAGLTNTEERMRERGLAWSQWQERNVPQPAPAPKINGSHNGSVNALAALAPMRKSEPRAELEVARKYRDQEAFLTEERKRFAEMGFVMREPEPLYDLAREHELDAIVRVLPYLEGIERANENLTLQNKAIRQPISELTEARSLLARQKEQIERMVLEKQQVKDDVQKMVDDHRRALHEKDAEIGELKDRLGVRRIDAAIGRVEVHEAVAKIG